MGGKTVSLVKKKRRRRQTLSFSRLTANEKMKKFAAEIFSISGQRRRLFFNDPNEID
jgi:hypothetical protein